MQGLQHREGARAALTDALARLDRGRYGDRSKLTVGDYLDQYLESRVNLHPAPVVFYRVAVERYLRAELEHLRLDQLRVDDVERAFARIRRGLDGHGHPISPTLIGRRKTTLRAALNVAFRRQGIHVNPAALVTSSRGFLAGPGCSRSALTRRAGQRHVRAQAERVTAVAERPQRASSCPESAQAPGHVRAV